MLLVRFLLHLLLHSMDSQQSLPIVLPSERLRYLPFDFLSPVYKKSEYQYLSLWKLLQIVIMDDYIFIDVNVFFESTFKFPPVKYLPHGNSCDSCGFSIIDLLNRWLRQLIVFKSMVDDLNSSPVHTNTTTMHTTTMHTTTMHTTTMHTTTMHTTTMHTTTIHTIDDFLRLNTKMDDTLFCAYMDSTSIFSNTLVDDCTWHNLSDAVASYNLRGFDYDPTTKILSMKYTK